MLNPKMILTRYISFPKLIFLLENGLFFPKATLFKDDLEGIIPLTSKGKKIKSISIEEIKSAMEWIYVNCWYEGDIENYAMWKIYGQINESIAIQTTEEKFRILYFENKNNMQTYFDKVRYKSPNTQIFEHFDSILALQNNLSNEGYPNLIFSSHFLFYKHIGYNFENEIRVVAIDNNVKKGKLNTKHGICIPIDPTINFIENIIISPFAPSWFKSTIEKMLLRYNCNANVLESELKLR